MQSIHRVIAVTAILAAIGAFALWMSPPVVAQVGVSTGDGGWVWQNPRPTGNDYHDVCFRGTLRGWAVGQFGTILHTFNGGITWYRQLSSTNETLEGVDFADAGAGWAVGDGATVLHTVNGGDTWERQDTGVDGWFVEVEALDPLHACIIHLNGTEVVSTSDGGQSWSATDLSSLLAGQTIHDISFADPLNGWIATSDFGLVLRTKDGGATWQARDSGPFYSSDSGKAHVAAIDALRACVVLEARSIYTTDGGLTWAKGNSATVAGANMDSISGIDLCGTGVGWAVSPFGVILRTVDGGAHWVKQRESTPVIGFQAVSCWGADHAWVAGGNGTLVGTNDGGAVWTTQSKGDLNTGMQCFMGIDFVDALNGWAVCDTVARTTDGGVKWTPLLAGALPIEPWQSLYDIDFTDATSGCAVGDGARILRTTDGGLTWSSAVTPPISSLLWDVMFIDADHGWAVGGDGVILHTADGGATWSLQDSALASDFLSGVDFLDAQRGWIVGSNPDGVQCTVDGGETWVDQGIESQGVSPMAVDMIDAERGWIACGGASGGVDAPLLSTGDGGTTWEAHHLGLDAGWSDVAFTDDQHGWAVGYFGRIVRTVDGGQNWMVQPSGTDVGLSSIAAVDQDTAWISGDHYGILHTFNGGLPIPDVVPPETETTGDVDGLWQNEPAELMLVPSDAGVPPLEGLAATGIEATGVQLSAWALDPTQLEPSRYLWKAKRSVKVTAQGKHKVVYRSIDNAGNVELCETVVVRVDTLPPTPKAPYAASVLRGGIVKLRYIVKDPRPGSPTANVKIVIKNSSGVIVKTVKLVDKPVNTALAYSFRCWLKRGVYRFYVSARDLAGNPQTAIAKNTLTVR